jgi:hypothetical protein
MREFELAALAYLVWAVWYEMKYGALRVTPTTTVKCFEDGRTYYFKIGEVLSYTKGKIDFLDWGPDKYKVYSVDNFRSDEFYIVHSFQEHNKIRFKLRDWEFFEVEDQQNHKYFISVDKTDNNIVKIESIEKPRHKFHYQFWNG